MLDYNLQLLICNRFQHFITKKRPKQVILRPYVPPIIVPETGQLEKETNHLCKETLRVIHSSINWRKANISSLSN